MADDQTAPPPGVDASEGSGLSGSEVKARTLRGIVTVGARGLAIRVLGLLGSVVLARQLSPSDFGVLAFGLTLVVFGKFLTDGGLVAGFVRRPEPPSGAELDALSGFQVGIAIVLALATTAVALPFGADGVVVAVMGWSLPIEALRGPTYALAERALDYRTLVKAEVLEIVLYNLVAIAGVLAGYGLPAVALAVVAKAIVGTALLAWQGPAGLRVPRLDLRALRPLLRFGVAVQGNWLMGLLRDQGLNVLAGAIAGTVVLGFWSLTSRLLQVIQLVFESVWRVSMPGVARLLESGEQVMPQLRRGYAVLLFVTGLILTPLSGAADVLVPVIFGPGWTVSAELLPVVSAAMMLSLPASTVGVSWLYASGEAETVVRIGAVRTIVTLLTAAALLPGLGAPAVAFGLLAGGLVDVIAYQSVLKHVGFSIARGLPGPLVAAVGGALAGRAVADLADVNLLGLAMASAASIAAYIVIVAAVSRGTARESLDVARKLRRSRALTPA